MDGTSQKDSVAAGGQDGAKAGAWGLKGSLRNNYSYTILVSGILIQVLFPPSFYFKGKSKLLELFGSSSDQLWVIKSVSANHTGSEDQA